MYKSKCETYRVTGAWRHQKQNEATLHVDHRQSATKTTLQSTLHVITMISRQFIACCHHHHHHHHHQRFDEWKML